MTRMAEELEGTDSSSAAWVQNMAKNVKIFAKKR